MLDPVSSFNFAITRKTCLWGLSYERIIKKHARLFAEYRVIHASGPSNTMIWRRLKEVVRQPGVGSYVRELNLPYGSDPGDPEEDIGVDIFNDAVSHLEGLYSSQSEETRLSALYTGCTNRFLDRESGPVLDVLVHDLPNLKTPRYTGREDHVSMFDILMEFINISPASQPFLPFKNLVTVVYASRAIDWWEPADWCFPFTCLPSLRNFLGYRIG
jgi:hypothetical protein